MFLPTHSPGILARLAAAFGLTSASKIDLKAPTAVAPRLRIDRPVFGPSRGGRVNRGRPAKWLRANSARVRGY